ncbi:MAG: hypothetical protein IH804_05205 [Planctomycetes bacterium]|nr:hypothetical protein [Planctomycetota bacterium]
MTRVKSDRVSGDGVDREPAAGAPSAEERTMEHVRGLLRYIGEDPDREGLRATTDHRALVAERRAENERWAPVVPPPCIGQPPPPSGDPFAGAMATSQVGSVSVGMEPLPTWLMSRTHSTSHPDSASSRRSSASSGG